MGAGLDALRDRLTTVNNLNKAGAVLVWDQSTYMPPGGVADRGAQLATLARISHELFTSDETGALLDRAAEEVAGLDTDSDESAIVRVSRKDYDRLRRIPPDLVSRLRSHATEARAVWIKAREENDYPAFAPYLQGTVELSKEMADAYGYDDRPYDALIQVSDPGITAADLDEIFASLREQQVPLIKEIASRPTIDDSVLHRPYDEAKQEAFAVDVVTRYRYDFQRGRLDRTVHPFEISLSIDDVRITTRYSSNFLSMSIFGTMHEAGHGMYEQGVDRGLAGTPLARGASSGMHESQSRMWENMVGRSRPFWNHYYSKLQSTFPDQLGSVDLDTFYRAVNRVEASPIRVEADELTYNMHIMLRYRLENDLMEGRLSVKDAPDAWRQQMQEYLGISPPSDTEGILQDTHWSSLLCTFPGYTLGNVFAAQLWEKATSDKPEITQEIEQGQFGTLFGWLSQNVYRHGRKYEPKELLQKVTGKPITTEPYIRYLKTKFGELYGDL